MLISLLSMDILYDDNAYYLFCFMKFLSNWCDSENILHELKIQQKKALKVGQRWVLQKNLQALIIGVLPDFILTIL